MKTAFFVLDSRSRRAGFDRNRYGWSHFGDMMSRATPPTFGSVFRHIREGIWCHAGRGRMLPHSSVEREEPLEHKACSSERAIVRLLDHDLPAVAAAVFASRPDISTRDRDGIREASCVLEKGASPVARPGRPTILQRDIPNRIYLDSPSPES